MDKILFIDACPRKESRTRRLAEVLLEKLNGDLETVCLTEEKFPDLQGAWLEKRMQDCRDLNFDDPSYRFAKQFAGADIIVIAAPFWDLSFPACLKKYIETITVTGITFRYSEEGVPVGLCRAKKLYYVTTAGGPVFCEEFGYGYIRTMAEGMYGVGECQKFIAENLDIIGNDPEQILQTSAQAIRETIKRD